MPLFLDDYQIESFSGQALEVLISIQEELADKLVTPNIALSAIKKWLLPHCDLAARDLIQKLSQPSWLELHETYLKIASDFSGISDEMRELAAIIDLIVAQSKSPPRKTSPRQSLDSTYYLVTCKQLGKDIQRIRYTKSGIDVLSFCKYCWRHPAPGKNICPHHATHSSEYRESYRIKQMFDCYTFERSSLESLVFLDGEFNSYFLPTTDIYTWLLKRRPHVADHLKSVGLRLNDKQIVGSLLKTLQPTQGYHWSALEACKEVNEWILRHPELIWPMLLRAETWFEMRTKIKNNWGGNKTRGKLSKPLYSLPPVSAAEQWIM